MIVPHYTSTILKAKAYGWKVKKCLMAGESSTFHRKEHIVIECVHNNKIQWSRFTIKDDKVVHKEYNSDIRILLEIEDKVLDRMAI